MEGESPESRPVECEQSSSRVSLGRVVRRTLQAPGALASPLWNPLPPYSRQDDSMRLCFAPAAVPLFFHGTGPKTPIPKSNPQPRTNPARLIRSGVAAQEAASHEPGCKAITRQANLTDSRPMPIHAGCYAKRLGLVPYEDQTSPDGCEQRVVSSLNQGRRSRRNSAMRESSSKPPHGLHACYAPLAISAECKHALSGLTLLPASTRRLPEPRAEDDETTGLDARPLASRSRRARARATSQTNGLAEDEGSLGRSVSGLECMEDRPHAEEG
ncbi:hypothetical protein JHW43_008379 [Diplocarpon mali]|nr:hypothetical protein JHW43_008379 [Diplocarpon mali]